MRETGLYQTLGGVRYFVPHPLPPTNPPWMPTAEVMSVYGEASFALGQLNEMSLRLPDPARFIKAYVLKEALLSSAIEGIHTTLIDVFTQDLGSSKPNKETQLVINYTHALHASLSMLQEQNLPLTTRVILRAHEVLMSSADAAHALPGCFRQQAVRVGDLIPAPPLEVPNLMSNLEKFIHAYSDIPPLIKAGFAHVQFETIHPFLDGNGRIGRLLIVLMLLDYQILKLPVLYPSYYFKKNHSEYYEKLDAVRTHGDFEGWILYYLQAIRDSALDAYTRAREIESLSATLHDMLKTNLGFVNIRENSAQVLDYLFAQPLTNASRAGKQIGKSYNTINKILDKFVELHLVSVDTYGKRHKLYRFDAYLTLLEKEYD